MLKSIVIATSLLLMAQAPTPGPAPVVGVSREDKDIIQEALAKTRSYLATIDPNTSRMRDPSALLRARDVSRSVDSQDTIDPASLPFVMFSLSRNSRDPKACALLQRIEPSAVCAK